VNRKRKFNLPPGKYKNPNICDSSNLENVSNALRYSNTIIFSDREGGNILICSGQRGDVGKTNNLTVFQQLGYRALFDISITPANIYRFFGSVEEGQGIILEDEIDDIDDQREKKKLYQGGYNSGKKVTRSDDTPSGGRQPQSYYVYGFKAFTSEKQPDSSLGLLLDKVHFHIVDLGNLVVPTDRLSDHVPKDIFYHH
jgi:hypothetical protein